MLFVQGAISEMISGALPKSRKIESG